MVNKRPTSAASFRQQDSGADYAVDTITPRGSSGQKTDDNKRNSSADGITGGGEPSVPLSRSRSGLLSMRLLGSGGGTTTGGSFSSKFRSSSIMNYVGGLASERSVAGREASATAASLLQRMQQSSMHRLSGGTETSFAYNGRSNYSPNSITGLKAADFCLVCPQVCE
jgi:hypothetical protein